MSLLIGVLFSVRFLQQDPMEAIPKQAMVITQYTTEQGLPSNTTYAIFQDDVGYLWLATERGIAQFDGQTFRTYQKDPQNPHSLNKNFIIHGFQDQKKRFWFLTAGLVQFDRYQESFRKIASNPDHANHFSSGNLLTVAETTSGKFWLGSQETIYYFDPDKEVIRNFSLLEKTAFLPKSPIQMLAGKGENVWLLNQQELTHFQQVSSQPLTFRMNVYDIPGGSQNQFRTFTYLDKNHLLLGSFQGFFLFDITEQSFRSFPIEMNPSLPKAEALAKDLWIRNPDEIWTGTDLGLFIHRRIHGEWQTRLAVPLDRQIAYPTGIIRIQPDRQGNVWISAENQGLYLIQPQANKFESVAIVPENPQDRGTLSVHSILPQDHDRLLVGTQKGLFEVSLSTDNPSSLPESATNNVLFRDKKIFCITQDRSGRKWVGTSGGLFWLNAANEVEKQFIEPSSDGSGPHSLSIRAIFEDEKGRIWLGYNGAGLGLWDPKAEKFKNWNRVKDNPHSLSNPFVNCFLEDRQGHLWIGTSHGLNLFQESRQDFLRIHTQEGNPTSIPDDFILSLHEDYLGGLWIGTYNGGLIHRQAGEGRETYTKIKGLPAKSIFGILEDTQGRLWLSTNHGICAYNPLDDNIMAFAISDGLLSMAFNSGAHHQSADGQLFFGSQRGLSMAHPQGATYIDPPKLPNLVLKDLEVNQRPARVRHPGLDEEKYFPISLAFDSLSSLTLPHDQSSLSLSFAGLQFKTSENFKFAYQLSGFSDEWIYPKAGQTTATFPKLSPGLYTFRVKATSTRGDWSSAEKTLRIRILPPFWKSSWAYALYALTLLATVLLISRNFRQKFLREQERVKKLIHFNQMKDVFLTNTSHELRNPLQGIIGLAETLKDQEPSKADQQAALSHIVSCGKRLAKLTDNILEFSQLTHHQIQLQRKPVDVFAMTEAVIALTKPLARHKDICFENKLSKDLPKVAADEDRLFQVLHNLIGNAQKYTQSGTISVDAFVVENHLTLSISDTGMGIPEEDLERIFLPNEQVLTDRHADLGGIGMGLPITKELLRLHGSELWVTSKLHQGSCFSFELPLTTEQKQVTELNDSIHPFKPSLTTLTEIALPRNPPEPSEDHRVRILVVDDDPLNVNILMQHLKTLDCSVHPATSGQDALACMEKEPPFDLILLDFMMPGLSGLDVSREIRQTHSRQTLPIIILTGKTQQHDLIRAYEEGVNDFLLKPISKGELLVRIQAQLEMSASHKRLEDAVDTRTEALNSALNDLSQKTQTLAQQKLKLEELYQWKTKFFTNLSHEFRTPLSLLISPLQDLLTKQAEGEAWIREAPRMLRNGHRILEHINQILDLAKIDAEKLELAYQSLDVVPFLKQCLTSFECLAQQRHIQLRFDSTLEKLTFGFDPHQLEKVIFNLLANAIGFSPQESDVVLGLEADDREVHIWVMDQGAGISPQDQEKIFDRYYQADHAKGNQRQGTGIGLALCHELITLHAGILKLDSEPSKGTTMQIILPRIASSSLPEKSWKPQPATSFSMATTPDPLPACEDPQMLQGQATLLIVEDDTDLRSYLAQQLSHYTVLEDMTGQGALALARKNMPDLILCDVCLPDIDGFEVCRELKQDPQTASIPIMLLTGLTARQHIYLGFEFGADDYITKPFHLKELKLRIHNLIRARQRLKDNFIPLLLGVSAPMEMSSSQQDFVKKACQILESHLDHVNFGTQILADKLSFSRSKLHRQMVQVLGIAPGEFIRRFRLQRAGLFLRKGSHNISEVAYAIGFRDPDYFGKQFKEAFGISPSQYQRAFGQTLNHGPSRYFSMTETSATISSVLS